MLDLNNAGINVNQMNNEFNYFLENATMNETNKNALVLVFHMKVVEKYDSTHV